MRHVTVVLLLLYITLASAFQVPSKRVAQQIRSTTNRSTTVAITTRLYNDASSTLSTAAVEEFLQANHPAFWQLVVIEKWQCLEEIVQYE